MTKLITNSEDLISVADSIRTKGWKNTSLEWPTGFVNAIDSIETGGGGATHTVTVDFDVNAPEVLYNEDGHPNGTSDPTQHYEGEVVTFFYYGEEQFGIIGESETDYIDGCSQIEATFVFIMPDEDVTITDFSN